MRAAAGVLFFLHIGLLIRGIVDLRSQFFCPVLWKNSDRPNEIALTFDDGPDPDCTPDVLRILEQFNMKATFFVIGEKAASYSYLIRLMDEKGHTVGCHDYYHALTSNLRFAGQMHREIAANRTIIENIIHRKPLLYRPPVGLANPHLPRALKSLGMTCIGWSASARDRGNRRNFSRIADLSRGGEVVLLHDALPVKSKKEAFLKNLTALCESIKNKNLPTLTIDEFFAIPAYHKL